MSINENMFLENYMTAYNNGEKICIIYKNNPIKSNINNRSVLAIVMFKDGDKKAFDNIDTFSLYIKELIDKAYTIRKKEVDKEQNTKLVFSKLFNLDLISAEEEMLYSLGMDPFDQDEYELVYKVKEIVKSNTKSLIDITWLCMSIINHNEYVEEEVLDRLSKIIKELNKDLYH